MTQLDLFSKRVVRRRWLEKVVIPRFKREGRLVRTGRIKRLLQIVETYLRDGAPFGIFETTVAEHMGVDERTVRRAIRDAEHLGLLTVQVSFDARNASVWSIDWVAIMELILADPTTASLIEQPRSRVGVKPAAEQSDTPDNLSDTPDNLSELSGVPSISSRARILNHHQTSCETFNQTSCSSSREKQNQEVSEGEDGEGQSKDDRDWELLESEGGYADWPIKIKGPHLQRPEFVRRLWVHAQCRGWCRPQDRRNVFRLAEWVVRLWQENVFENPGGQFTARLKEANTTGRWPSFNADDIRRANEALDLLFRPKPLDTAAETARLAATVQRMIARDNARKAK